MYYMERRRYRRRQARRAKIVCRVREALRIVMGLIPEILGGIAILAWILYLAPILYTVRALVGR